MIKYRTIEFHLMRNQSDRWNYNKKYGRFNKNPKIDFYACVYGNLCNISET